MSRWDDLRDRLLADDIRDVLGHDCRLDARGVAVAVRGGVAHVTGTVGTDDERWLVRRLIGRVRGIHAVWDLLRLPGDGPARALDLGCGSTRQWDGSIGVDCYPLAAVDLLADLERGLPFADNAVDVIFAVHVLEHLHDLLTTMAEIHRVLKPGGLLHVMVPHWQNVIAVADPTHVRYFSPQTFEYLCRPRAGSHRFRPLLVSASSDTIYADLQPVKDGGPGCEDDLVARFFR
jgi:SAM-dependent methyltransferase